MSLRLELRPNVVKTSYSSYSHYLTFVSLDLAVSTYEYLLHLELADSTDGTTPVEVDILIGSDNYWDLVTGETIRCDGGPVAINTRIGWLLSGPLPLQRREMSTHT